jgi:hypothetical protein
MSYRRFVGRMAQGDPTFEGISQGFICGILITISRNIPILVKIG